MTDAPENTGQMMMLLGELRGQVRELVHSVNNLRQDVGTVFEKMAATQGIPAEVVKIEARVTAVETRLTALEAVEHQRKGAITLGSALLKAVPWLLPAGVGAAVLAFVGKGIGL